MPARVFIATEEKSVSGSEEQALLLGDNAANDVKWKPMFVYHFENPSDLKEYAKFILPELYKCNNKA